MMKRFGALACLGVLLAAPACFAQDIATAKSNLWVNGTNTYFAQNTSSYVTVVGRVTSGFLSYTNTTEIFIQDDSAGIKVMSVPGAFGVETNSAAFAPGVQVTVYGKIAQANGMRSIRPEYYTVGDYYNSSYDFYISSGTPVPYSPQLITLTDLNTNGEDLEGKLVRVNGVTIETNAWTYRLDDTYAITDATGSVSMWIDRDTDVDGQLRPTNTFDLVGIVIQYSTATVPSNGYQIMPRYYTDVIQTVGAEPPSLLVPTNVTATINNPFQVYLVAQDRNAGDALVITTNQSPNGSTLTSAGNREACFSWTPGAGLQGTSTTVVFSVTDGTTTNTASMVITVRAASGGAGYGWINEFHYDNIGIDTNEGVEIAGEAGISLTNYYILYYNGSDGRSYASNRLSGVIDDEGHGYGAVWFAAVSAPQNGSPDGIALCHDTAGLLQFISYEGVFTASAGPAAGIGSIDVGVAEDGTTTLETQSLQLQGTGTNYEAFTWSGPMTESRGDLNGSGQIILGPVNALVRSSGLALVPARPQPGSPFDITCKLTPNYSASNLTATAYWRANAGSWTGIGMTDGGNGQYTTSSKVPAQTNGTPFDYYVSVSFQGPGPNSPSSSVTNSLVIMSYPPTIATLTNIIVQVSNTCGFAVAATEPDGDLITLTASNVPVNAIFYPTNGVSAASGWFTFTPDVSQIGVYTTAFYAVDKDGAVFSNVLITVNPRGYFVSFENGESKTAYASNAAPLVLNGIGWGFSDALIGNSAADRKNGAQSARLRYGTMTMVADKTNGCGVVSLKYARYGTDGVTTGRVEYSADSGTNWTHAGSDFVALTTNLADFSATVNVGGNVRVRISRLGASTSLRVNIDDILMTDFTQPVTDSDSDGMPDEWELLYFGGATNADAAADPDGDGYNNLAEYIASTIPVGVGSTGSYFAIDSFVFANGAVISVPSTTGRLYTFEASTNVLAGAGWTNLPGTVTGIVGSVAVTNVDSSALRSYRVKVQLQ